MKVLVTGARGMLARDLLRELRTQGHEPVPLDRQALDVTDRFAVHSTLRMHAPDVVVQCAAYTRVDDAEREEAQALAINGEATRYVAEACADMGARLVYPSTDYVFDGTATEPYAVDHPVAPVNAYGRTKLAGELAALTADALVVRTAWLYGAGGRSFIRTILGRARAHQTLRVVNDQRGAPTWTSDLARTIVRLLDCNAPSGVYHATNVGEATWYELACAAVQDAGVTAEIAPVPSSEFPTPARRPSYSVLDCSATWSITGPAPHWRDALRSALQEGFDDA